MASIGLTSRRGFVTAMNTLMGQLGALGRTGNVFFVSSTQSGAADDTNHGTDPNHACATINYTIGRCTASNGDIVVVLPGHVESITAAASIALNVAGVSLIGVGNGRNRPTLTWTTAVGASIDITAANCRISNFVLLLNGVDAVTAGINIQAADCEIDGNEIVLADATYQATLGILTTAAADRLHIHHNRIYGTIDAGCATAIRVVGGNDIHIEDNYIHGAFTTTLGGVQNVTTACLRVKIANNTIVNSTASSTICITLVSTTTGSCTGNRLGILSGTAPVVGAALDVMGANYYKAAAGAAAGTLI